MFIIIIIIIETDLSSIFINPHLSAVVQNVDRIFETISGVVFNPSTPSDGVHRWVVAQEGDHGVMIPREWWGEREGDLGLRTKQRHNQNSWEKYSRVFAVDLSIQLSFFYRHKWRKA